MPCTRHALHLPLNHFLLLLPSTHSFTPFLHPHIVLLSSPSLPHSASILLLLSSLPVITRSLSLLPSLPSLPASHYTFNALYFTSLTLSSLTDPPLTHFLPSSHHFFPSAASHIPTHPSLTLIPISSHSLTFYPLTLTQPHYHHHHHALHYPT